MHSSNTLTPTSPRPAQAAGRRLPTRLAALVIGLILYGVAIALMVVGGVGVPPWDVLTQGISLRTGLPFGLVTNLIGVVVLLLWIPLRQKPGIGTILNVLVVGTAAQAALLVLPTVEGLWLRILFFVAGLLLLAVASGLYISPQLGPGPRDGLMTGLNQRLGVPIWVARTTVEVLVVAMGWLLGGNVGVGTLIFAITIGPLCQRTLPWFAARVPGKPSRNTRPTPPGEVALSGDAAAPGDR